MNQKKLNAFQPKSFEQITTFKSQKQSALENKEKNFLLLSEMFKNEKFHVFFLGKKNLVRKESDGILLNKIEKFIHEPAANEKIIAFEKFIQEDQQFSDYETLRQKIKEKDEVLEYQKNKYFLKFNSFDLDNLFLDIPKNFEPLEEIKMLILRTFNFLAKKIPFEQLCRLFLSIAVSSDEETADYTYYFNPTGAIVTIFSKTWWDKTDYVEKQWTCVDKSGTPFVHEMGHVLHFFSSHQKSDFFLINCLNIKQLYLAKKPEKWKYFEPLQAKDILEINKLINSDHNELNYRPEQGFSPKFSQFIFEKVIELLNKNVENVDENYSFQQPNYRYYMIICALIPSNYSRHQFIVANFETEKGIDYAMGEFFAEAFSFLISAKDEDKNIFWEWTYDFIMEELSWL